MALASVAAAQRGNAANAVAPADDPIRILVGRLDLEHYKNTIKGLTQFGDRRQGTARNRAAVDWIEAQLKSYGCTNTQRVVYQYTGRQLRNDSTDLVDSLAGRSRPGRGGAAGGRGQPAAGGGRGGGRGAAADSAAPAGGIRYGAGGNVVKGN